MKSPIKPAFFSLESTVSLEVNKRTISLGCTVWHVFQYVTLPLGLMSFGVHLDRKTCHCLSCTDTTAGGPVSSTHPVSTETLSGFCQPLTVSAPKGGVWVHTQTLLEMPSTPCTEASPSLMAGGCLLVPEGNDTFRQWASFPDRGPGQGQGLTIPGTLQRD